MRVQHNIAAMNSYRNYSNNTNTVAKNLEKLSSGYRINRAGDDAAGLAISEKMRAQITGLETAQKNASDGVSLVQTAEGALTEVHSMLNRMTELADQASNGTYQDEVDREQLQKEITSLKSEIDRIADGTNFNGINLLDGSLDGAGNVKGGINLSEIKATFGSAKTVKFETGSGNIATDKKIVFGVSWEENGVTKGASVELTAKLDNGKAILVDKDGNELARATDAKVSDVMITDALVAQLGKNADVQSAFNISIGADKSLVFESKVAGKRGAHVTSFSTKAEGDDATIKGGGFDKAQVSAGEDIKQELDFAKVKTLKAGSVHTTEDIRKATFEVGGHKFVFAGTGSTAEEFKNLPDDVTVIADDATTAGVDTADMQNIADVLNHAFGEKVFSPVAGTTKLAYDGKSKLSAGGNNLSLQIGDTSASYNQLNVSIKDTHAVSLGISNVDISTQQGAKDAVKVIKDAINYVSDIRGGLGATQNRLEHTINNLSVATENMTAAESRIRDVDVAKEMMAYTKNNILVQSAQAMLAQANQTPQGVLQLLQ